MSATSPTRPSSTRTTTSLRFTANRYYESTNKKTKGNRVFKTTTVKDEYGQTVYKNTTSHKKKKKK
jgi:hypothetical protein